MLSWEESLGIVLKKCYLFYDTHWLNQKDLQKDREEQDLNQVNIHSDIIQIV